MAKRLKRELANLAEKTSSQYSAGPIGDDIYVWQATILGPRDSPYEGGTFSLSITFSTE